MVMVFVLLLQFVMQPVHAELFACTVGSGHVHIMKQTCMGRWCVLIAQEVSWLACGADFATLCTTCLLKVVVGARIFHGISL